MSRQLVFVHGRSQQHKDAVALKAAWIEAWTEGLRQSGLDLPITEQEIRFPYYGDTLDDLVSGVPVDEIHQVLVRGAGDDTDRLQFAADVFQEVRVATGITDQQLMEVAGSDVVERGPQNWKWVQGILRAVDRFVPGGSGTALELATYDVYQYLKNPGIRDVIDSGVRTAITSGIETVVVGHSLGSVVSYNLLQREGAELGWKVPLYVTVGCPLAIREIQRSLAPISHPGCAPAWFNARDARDVVALYPLDPDHFRVGPAVENKNDVDNNTSNRHGISGYLADAVVARRIYDALTAP